MFGACAFWGLMAPLGKDAMTHGLDGLTMVSFRVLGGCLLFWLTSLFVKKEYMPSQPIPTQTWLEAGYVVVFGTYVGYILTMIGQKTLLYQQTLDVCFNVFRTDIIDRLKLIKLFVFFKQGSI